LVTSEHVYLAVEGFIYHRFHQYSKWNGRIKTVFKKCLKDAKIDITPKGDFRRTHFEEMRYDPAVKVRRVALAEAMKEHLELDVRVVTAIEHWNKWYGTDEGRKQFVLFRSLCQISNVEQVELEVENIKSSPNVQELTVAMKEHLNGQILGWMKKVEKVKKIAFCFGLIAVVVTIVIAVVWSEVISSFWFWLGVVLVVVGAGLVWLVCWLKLPVESPTRESQSTTDGHTGNGGSVDGTQANQNLADALSTAHYDDYFNIKDDSDGEGLGGSGSEEDLGDLIDGIF